MLGRRGDDHRLRSAGDRLGDRGPAPQAAPGRTCRGRRIRIDDPDHAEAAIAGDRLDPLLAASAEAGDHEPCARISSMAWRHRPVTLMAARAGRPSMLRGRVARGALGALAVRVAGSAFAFASAVLLSRALGAAGYGAFAWAAALTLGLARPAGLGASLLLTRHGAASAAPYGSRPLAPRVAGVVALVSTAVAAMVALIVVLAPLAGSASERALLFALPALPATALVAIPQGVLQGLGRPAAALLPTTLLQQAPFLALVAVTWAIKGGHISSSIAAAALGITSMAALAWGAVAASRALPGDRNRAQKVQAARVLRPLAPLA